MSVYISPVASLSALGAVSSTVEKGWERGLSGLSYRAGSWQAPLHEEAEIALQQLLYALPELKKYDRSVQMAVWAYGFVPAGEGRRRFLQVASSRGTTGLLERYHEDFLADESRRAHPRTSPYTTFGNMAAACLRFGERTDPATGMDISATCSSMSMAVVSAAAWLEADMTDEAIVIGAEAPLTGFTIRQMQAMGIYSAEAEGATYPCRSGDPDKPSNTMVLGEASVALSLSREKTKGAMLLTGWGAAVVPARTLASVSAEGQALKVSMQQALERAGSPSIQAVVAHMPGTTAGDAAEISALCNVFGHQVMPLCYQTKWLTGHALGASAGLNILLAEYLLNDGKAAVPPWVEAAADQPRMERILINSLGFGEHAVSLVLERV